MSRRSRPHYHSGLEWILGVAFEDTLTRRPGLLRGSLTFGAAVRLGLLPHTASRRQRWRLTTAGTACSCLRLAVATTSPREGLSPPIQCPCQAHLRRLRFPNWRGRRPGSPSSSARSAGNRSTSIFFAKPCVSSTRGTLRLARRHLRGHPSDERAGDARRHLHPASVRARRRFARRLLSSRRGSRPRADRGGLARQDSEDRARKPLLRLSTGVSGPLAHPWPEGQPQACSAADARG